MLRNSEKAFRIKYDFHILFKSVRLETWYNLRVSSFYDKKKKKYVDMFAEFKTAFFEKAYYFIILILKKYLIYYCNTNIVYLFTCTKSFN